MKKSNYEVDIVVNGKPLKEYYHEGKTYIEGKKKTEFSLRIKNNGSAKIVAIPSVDGLSAMNGKIASFNSGGYVINGYDSIIIDGWRKSDKEVARFYFSDPEDSYSQRKGDGNNLGIIGVAVFQEKHDIQKDFEELKREEDLKKTKKKSPFNLRKEKRLSYYSKWHKDDIPVNKEKGEGQKKSR